MKYTAYCICFMDGKYVRFWDEIKDKQIGKVAITNVDEARRITTEWRDNAPEDVICQIMD